MIKIEFSEDYNIPVIRAALVESYMGYAGDVLPDLLGTIKILSNRPSKILCQ
jgi:hypothetical protein